MKITFLGTAAATSYPLAFCRCEYCNQARELGGKDYRKRSSIIINNDLLIDMGPDIITASCLYNKPITDIRYCLQTHSHSDHFDPSHLTTRVPDYMGINTPPLQLFGSEATLQKMSEMIANEGYISNLLNIDEQKRLNLDIVSVQKHQSFIVGRYLVTAFPANHDCSVDSFLYSITEKDFSVFYGTDTDILPEETWHGFHQKELRFNAVILDHTYGPNIFGGGHLNANKFIEHIQRMKAENLLADNARILATHLSHEGNPPYAVLSEYAAQYGYEIAYDGLVI